MRLNMDGAPDSVREERGPIVGDIYRKAGGSPGFWWVISVTGSGDVYVLSFDMQGLVTGAQRYGRSYLAERDHRRVGHADVPLIDVEWYT